MDAFERLGLPKALVLETEVLEARFREMSKVAHPDAGGAQGEFEELRKAYEILKSPLERLRVALESEDARGSVPEEVMDLFGPVAEGVQAVEDFVGERAAARSELGKAVLDTRVPELKAELESLAGLLEGLESSLVSRFEKFDAQGWEHNQELMGETARGLAFVTKWQAQVRVATGKLFEALLG